MVVIVIVVVVIVVIVRLGLEHVFVADDRACGIMMMAAYLIVGRHVQ